MSAVLPDPVPLGQPEEDPGALEEARAAVTGAVFRLGTMAAQLAGPAATAPDWLGEDAAAALSQIGAVAAVVREAHDALARAAERLGRHAELLAETRHAITALRAEQDEEYRAAGARLADALLAPAVPTAPAHPAVVVVLGDELRASDAARQRRHAALLADLHSDAVATARVLGAAAAAVGGSGRAGDGERVVAALAARLPGWGDGELSARGADLARALLGPGTPDQMEARARAAAPYAGAAAFADAVLAGLGPDGLRWLFSALPADGLTAGSATARLLALALGGAHRSGTPVDPVGEVLDATYVRERARGIDDDVVALGLATVLAAAPTGRGAIPATTVARWGGQVLRREEYWRSVTPAAAGARDRAGRMYPQAPDPVAEVVRTLAAAGDPAAAAAVLPDRGSWDLVLRRGELAVLDRPALTRFVELVGAAPGAAGETATRAGLEALGAGIAGEDPDHWEVARSMADALALPLASALAHHPEVLSEVLLAAADGGGPSAADAAALRVLGYASRDAGASSVLTEAVAGWGRDHAGVPNGSSLPAAPLAIGALVAVREYGQRLEYALHGFELRDAAENAQAVWDLTVGLFANLLKGYAQVAAVLEPFAAHWLGYDGAWDNGRDAGLRLDRDDAVALAQVELGAPGAPPDASVARSALAGFTRTSRALGLPLPPTSPEWSWEQALLDAVPTPEVREVDWEELRKAWKAVPEGH